MYRRLGALGLVAVGVLAIACSDNRDNTPTAPQAQLTGLACSPSQVANLAKNLLGNGSTGHNIAKTFTSDQTANIPRLFNLLAEVATLADTSIVALTAAQRTAVGNLTVQGIACADVTVTDEDYTGGSADVTKFATAVGPTGAYEVRGRTASDNGDVKSHNVSAGATGASGLRAPTEGFLAWQGSAALFYGFPIDGFSDEDPAIETRVAFEWFTVRARTAVLNDQLSAQVAICVNFDPDAGFNSGQFRIVHDNTILPVVTFPLCPVNFTSLGFRHREPASSFAAALAWLGRTPWSPEPLEATSFLLGTPGGSPKKLSPTEAVNPNGVTLRFVSQPTNGFKNKPINGNPETDVQVKAEGAGGTPWEGVHIKISALTNNSVLINPDPLCNEADTGEDGIAHFPKLSLQKPGGVTFVASTVPANSDPDVSQFQSASVNAKKVNIKNSSFPTPSCQ